jgi:hypothetical protein
MNFRFQISDFILNTIVLAFVFAFCFSARADDLKAEATLSETTTSMREPVELQIKITGAAQASVPRAIAVDGLSIAYATHASQQGMQFSFGGPNSGKHDLSSLSVTYTVTPQREGTFTIPEVAIEAAGKKLTTSALTLTVKADAGGGLQKADSHEQTIFAELVPSRLQAYVGEAVPIELRIYVDDRVRWNMTEPPNIKTDGFTMQKLTNSQPTNTTRNGRAFNLLVFRTAVTPVKAGKLQIGPGELKIIAQIPQQKRKRTHTGGGLFDDDFFNDPFGMFAPQQQITIDAKPVDLEVKALPAGKPKSFCDAVGRYTFSVDATPRNVHVGDPITVTMKISGRGDFDRITSPRLSEESGWRSYPPSGKFAADDEIGINGTKTFEMAVVPEDKKTELPSVEFSYFDPVLEKYVTEKSGRISINVDGQKIIPAATPNQPVQATATSPDSRKTTAIANDILYIRTDAARWGQSFEPLFRRRGFWLVQGIPFLALIGLVSFHKMNEKARNAELVRLAGLRREKAAAEKILLQQDSAYSAFIEAATKCLQIETSMTTAKNFAAIDAEDVCGARTLNQEIAARIRSIFAECNEVRYAGTAGSGGHFTAQQRSEIVGAIQHFEKAKANV